MKKVNLLSRAEMRKVVGGNPVVLGCEVTCSTLILGEPFYPRVLTASCSEEDQIAACALATPVPFSCGNCTIDNDEW